MLDGLLLHRGRHGHHGRHLNGRRGHYHGHHHAHRRDHDLQGTQIGTGESQTLNSLF